MYQCLSLTTSSDVAGASSPSTTLYKWSTVTSYSLCDFLIKFWSRISCYLTDFWFGIVLFCFFPSFWWCNTKKAGTTVGWLTPFLQQTATQIAQRDYNCGFSLAVTYLGYWLALSVSNSSHDFDPLKGQQSNLESCQNIRLVFSYTMVPKSCLYVH